MKKCIIIVFLSFCSALYGQNRETPYQTKSLSGQKIDQVEVSTSGGSISVTGVPESEARVEVYVHGNNAGSLSKEELENRLENYSLKISVSGNKVVAQASPREKNMNWKKGLSISFRVYVPEKVTSSLKTSGGSIHLANLTGNQDFSTSGGSLHIAKLRGNINGKTSGGSIHAEGSSGEIDLSTSGGSVNLTSLSGTIRANTSGGSIRSSNITGQLHTRTSGGSIRMSEMSCSLEASTSGGSIDVQMKDLGKYVKLENSGGNIQLQIPGSKGATLDIRGRKVSTSALKNFNGRMEDDKIEGSLNGGGIPVTVDASSGGVTLVVR
jgi:hypothetical protein